MKRKEGTKLEMEKNRREKWIALVESDPKPSSPVGSEEFMECAICRTKPGSPTLCRACLHNRAVIGNKETRWSKYKDKNAELTVELDLAKEKTTAALGMLRAGYDTEYEEAIILLQEAQKVLDAYACDDALRQDMVPDDTPAGKCSAKLYDFLKPTLISIPALNKKDQAWAEEVADKFERGEYKCAGCGLPLPHTAPCTLPTPAAIKTEVG